MSDLGVFLHSPFSEKNISEGNHKYLLIQFMLCELFKSLDSIKNKDIISYVYAPGPSSFYPLDWSSQRGHLNKVLEHSQLLHKAFEQHRESISVFKHALNNTTNLIINHLDTPSDNFESQLGVYFKQLFLLLEPIVKDCLEDENFLFFLLKNQEKVHSVTYPKYLNNFLQKHFGTDVESICESVCDKFHARGFANLIPEVKTAIYQLKNENEQPIR